MGLTLIFFGVLSLLIGIYNFIADPNQNTQDRVYDPSEEHDVESAIPALLIEIFESPMGKIIFGLVLILLGYYFFKETSTPRLFDG